MKIIKSLTDANHGFSDIRKLLAHNTIIVLVLGLVFLVDFSLEKIGIFRCPLYHIVGLPCPTCGMTRATHAFLAGDFGEVLNYNWSFYLILLLGCILFFRPVIKFKYLNHIIFGLIGLVLLLFLFRMILVFPNHEVLNYNYDAFLYRLLKGSL